MWTFALSVAVAVLAIPVIVVVWAVFIAKIDQ